MIHDEEFEFCQYAINASQYVDLANNTTIQVESGSHILTVVCEDTTGNLGGRTVEFNVDMPPRIEKMVYSATVIRGQANLIYAEISDDFGLSKVELIIEFGNNSETFELPANSSTFEYAYALIFSIISIRIFDYNFI